MASAADPSLWRDSALDTPPAQWQAVDSDGRWWWSGLTFSTPNPITYIGDRPLPTTLDFDWEIVTPPAVPGVLSFNWVIEGVGSGTIELGTTVSSGSISLPTAGYTPSGVVSFYISSQYDEGAYGGSVALLGPDIPAVAIYDIHLSWSASDEGTYPIELYRLYRSLDGGAYALLDEIAADQPHEYIDLNITQDVEYAYRVRGIDTQGNESVDSNVITLEQTAPVET